MKKIISIVLACVLLLSLSSCRGKYTRGEMEETVAHFTEALKVYDSYEMSRYLTEFPDNEGYVYLDDIFNDEGYLRLYRILYEQITCEVVSAKKDKVVIKVHMPNIQNLYTVVSMIVVNMAIGDETLQDKLSENDENSIVLIQEAMIAYAKQGNYSMMEQEFTLSFGERGGVPVIVCDDELRAFMTGNLYLSKNITAADVAGGE